MKIQKVRFVKTPTRGTKLSAGLDFYVPDEMLAHKIAPRQSILIPSGIKVEIPKGHALIAFNKSGIALKKDLQIGACVIDEDYQGEIHIHLINIGNNWQTINPGDKIAQFIIIPISYNTVEVVDSLHENISERGTGGFGSTGGGLSALS